MNRFELEEVYFRLTYPDRDMLFPNVESFVYLGENLSDEDMETTWYFQPSRDFAKYGSALSQNRKRITPVVCVTKKNATDMLDLSMLLNTLEGISQRRKKQNKARTEKPGSESL